MNTKELKELNEKSKKIEQLRDNIDRANKNIVDLEKSIKDDAIFYRVTVRTYKRLNSDADRYNETYTLLGTTEIVRALKDSVSATKGYLHHLEKEFNRR